MSERKILPRGGRAEKSEIRCRFCGYQFSSKILILYTVCIYRGPKCRWRRVLCTLERTQVASRLSQGAALDEVRGIPTTFLSNACFFLHINVISHGGRPFQHHHCNKQVDLCCKPFFLLCALNLSFLLEVHHPRSSLSSLILQQHTQRMTIWTRKSLQGMSWLSLRENLSRNSNRLMINGIKARYMFWLEVSGSKSKAAMIGCRPWPRDHYLISVLRRPSTNDLQVTIQVMSAAERASQTWVCCFFGGWFVDWIDHFFVFFIGICPLLLSRTETIEYHMDSD